MTGNRYSDKVIDHFSNPRRCGKLKSPDGIGKAVSPGCGDTVWIYLVVEHEYITDISFQAYGCPCAMACASMATELALGKHIDEAIEILDEHMAQALELPDEKVECSAIAARALHEAIYSYVFSNRERVDSGTGN